MKKSAKTIFQDSIGSYLANLDDPRSPRNQRHNFITLVCTTLCAVLSGMDSFLGIQEFVESHFKELSKYFDLSGGVPSHDTYRRIWNEISPDQFGECFEEFIECLKTNLSRIISIDGKTIRNSGTEHPLHLVSAYCHSNQLVFCQQKINSKSNEITAIPKLLRMLSLKDKIITIDAMGAQRAICDQIIRGFGDYVISLKGNQSNLNGDVRLFFEAMDEHTDKPSIQINRNLDKGHGRIEERIALVTSDIDWLQRRHNWPGLRSIGKIIARVTGKDGRETEEERYYISSLANLTAGEFNEIARKHWGIENQLHWKLDVVFNEDKCCIHSDNAAENLDILRKWALAIMTRAKRKPDQSTKSVLRKNSMSFKYLMDSMKVVFAERESHRSK
jgi:predicted transposase YbfD/YdcC